jgi:hypothetical protein
MANARDAREAFLAGSTDLQKARRAEIDAVMAEKPASFLGQLGSTGGLLSGGLTLAALLSGEQEAAGELLLGGLAGTANKVDVLRSQQASRAKDAVEAFYTQVEEDQKKAADLMKANSALMIESAGTDAELNSALGLPGTFSLKTGYANLKEEENRQKAANGILMTLSQGGNSTTYDSRKASLSEYYRLMGVAVSDDSLSLMAERGASVQDLFDASKNSTTASFSEAMTYLRMAEQASPGAMQEQDTILAAMSLLRRNPTAAELSNARDVSKDAALLDAYTTAAKLMREHQLTWEDALDRLIYVAPDKASAVKAFDKDASFGMRGWIDANLNYEDIIAETQDRVRSFNEDLEAQGLPLLDVDQEIAKALNSARSAMAAVYSAGSTAIQGDTYNRALVVTGDLLGFDPTAGPIDESSSILISQYGEDLMLKAQYFYEQLPQEVKDQYEGMVRPDGYVEGVISYGEQMFVRQFMNELTRANMQNQQINDAIFRETGIAPTQQSVNVGQVMNDILYRVTNADATVDMALEATVAGKMPKEPKKPVDEAVPVDSFQPTQEPNVAEEPRQGPLPGMEKFGEVVTSIESNKQMVEEEARRKEAEREKARRTPQKRVDLLTDLEFAITPPTESLYAKMSPEEIMGDIEDRLVRDLALNKFYSGGKDEKWLREKARERLDKAKGRAADLLAQGRPIPRDPAGMGMWLWERTVGGGDSPTPKASLGADKDTPFKPSNEYPLGAIDRESPGDREKVLMFSDNQISALITAVSRRKLQATRGGAANTKKIIADAREEVYDALRAGDVHSYEDAWRKLGLAR